MAVVQQEDVARGEILRETAENRARACRDGVEATPGPAHELQVGACQHRLEKQVAQTGRRAKEARHFTGGEADHLLRADDFAGESARTEEREALEVPVAVVADLVSLCRDGARERRMTRDALTDAEEGCPRAMGREHLENALGHPGLGAVIDRECHRSGGVCGRRQARPVRSQQATTRPESRAREQQVIGDDHRERPGPELRLRDCQSRRAQVQ